MIYKLRYNRKKLYNKDSFPSCLIWNFHKGTIEECLDFIKEELEFFTGEYVTVEFDLEKLPEQPGSSK